MTRRIPVGRCWAKLGFEGASREIKRGGLRKELATRTRAGRGLFEDSGERGIVVRRSLAGEEDG